MRLRGWFVVLGLVVGGVSSLFAADSPLAGKRPNILLILADDMGYSDIGCYGGEIHTPNIDSLSATGIRFTQFYNEARCCPSRTSLLTGLYPQQAGVGDMTSDKHLPGYTGKLNDSCVTLAEVLKSAGYQTYMSGKWHVGKILPTTRGFDRFYGFYTGYTVNSWNPEQMGLFPPGPMHAYAPGEFYAANAITDYAIDFINQARQTPDHPWFTYLAYQAAHFPLMAPKAKMDPYVSVYEKGWDEIRDARLARMKQLGLLSASSGLSPRSLIPDLQAAKRDGLDVVDNPPWDSLAADRREDLAYRMAAYAGMVETMDDNIGRVLADLKSHGELDNTLIVFLSDNGACADWAPYGFDLKLRYPGSDGTHGTGHGYDGGTEKSPPILHTGPALATIGQRGGSGSSYGSGWANACNTPFRMYKHYDHEGGISTPLIVHWPAIISDPGTFRTQVGDVIDLMPTLVALSGATYPAQFNNNPIDPMEGKSLLPAFLNQPIARDAIFWEHENNRAVRVGDMKLVGLAGQPWELYDLSKDRIEQHDLSASQPDEVRKLTALWNSWAARCNVVVPKKDEKVTETPSDAAD